MGAFMIAGAFIKINSVLFSIIQSQSLKETIN